MIKAIIFDFFGVLVTEGWLQFKDEYFGNNPNLFDKATDIGRQANLGLLSQQEFLKQIAELAKIPIDEVHKSVMGNVPNKLLFSYINELKSGYKIGLLSNIMPDHLQALLTPEQIALFDVLSLSCETGFVKPDERAYLTAANELSLSPKECVMIDDQNVNVEGAVAVGMEGVLYRDFAEARDEIEGLLADSKG